jgi:hypothetical protein
MASRKASPPRRRGNRIPRIPKARQTGVSRGEFNRVIEMLNQRGNVVEEYGNALATIRRDLDIQFRRIAQLQAELDQIEQAWAKMALG